jgi:hypothetical protein
MRMSVKVAGPIPIISPALKISSKSSFDKSKFSISKFGR